MTETDNEKIARYLELTERGNLYWWRQKGPEYVNRKRSNLGEIIFRRHLVEAHAKYCRAQSKRHQEPREVRG